MAADGPRAHPLDDVDVDMEEDDARAEGDDGRNEPAQAAIPPGLSSSIRSFIERCVAERVHERMSDVIGMFRASGSKSAADKPDKWDGNGNVDDHIRSVRIYLAAKHIEPSDWVAQALTFLTPTIASFLERTAAEQSLNLSTLSWEHYCAFLRKSTVAEDPQTTVRMRLSKLQACHGKMDEYVQSFRSIVADIRDDEFKLSGAEACGFISRALKRNHPALYNAVYLDTRGDQPSPWTDYSAFLQVCLATDHVMPAPKPKSANDGWTEVKGKKRRAGKAPSGHDAKRTTDGDGKPMRFKRLSDEERADLKAKGICTYCRDPNNKHTKDVCPKLKGKSAAAGTK